MRAMKWQGPVLAGAAIAVVAGSGSAAWAQNRNLPGWKTYVEKCAVCHGEEGGGDGPAAKTMLPRPRVFKKTNYKFRTTASGALPMREDLFKVITDGIHGTAMPSFAHLPEETRFALIDVVESFSEDFRDPDLQEDRKPLPLPGRPELDLKRGYQVYLDTKCWECHGPTGLGNGPTWADKKDDEQNPIMPADFSRWQQLRCGYSIECLFRATQTGLNGTPMPRMPMKDEDRWHLAAWLQSIQQPRKEPLDRVVLAKRLEELPASPEDEKWGQVPQQIFYLVGQVVQKPRLFWPAVTEVMVRAAYNDREIALLVEWDDRDRSKGTNLTEFRPEEDPVTTIFVPFGNPPHTDHPDQLAVQFPDGKYVGGEERPYFLFGDSGHEVNLWWWGSHLSGGTGKQEATSSSIGGVIERNASGSKNLVDQPAASQQVVGQVVYPTTKITVDGRTQELPIGRYKALFRRTLTTDDEHDVQFQVGKFIPIAFNAWQGSQGEVGLRRAVSTWYLLVLEPSVPRMAYVAPVIAGGVVLALLLLVVIRVRRAPAPAPEEAVPVPAEVEPATVPLAAPKPLAPELEQPGRITVTGIVTVAAVTGLAAYLVVVGLSGLLTHLGEKEKVQMAEEKEGDVKELKAEQGKRISDYEWVDPKARTIKLPIERAMELVVEDAAKGDASKLVPAVGAQDKPTQPPVPGKQEPPKPGQPAAPAAGQPGAQPAASPAPGQPGSPATRKQPGSSAAPAKRGSPAAPAQSGSSAAPAQPGGSAVNVQPGSPASPAQPAPGTKPPPPASPSPGAPSPPKPPG